MLMSMRSSLGRFNIGPLYSKGAASAIAERVLVGLYQVRHGIEAEIDPGHRPRIHGRTIALLGVAAINPAAGDAMLVGRAVVVEQAFSGVQQLALLQPQIAE